MPICNSFTRFGVTLTRCNVADQMHLYFETTDPQTRAFKVTVFTESGGAIRVVDAKTPATTFVMTGELGGKLLHITVEELQTVRSAAFSDSDGTLP